MQEILKDIDSLHKARKAMAAVLRHYRNPKLPINLDFCKGWVEAINRLEEKPVRRNDLKPEKVRIREFI
jgi:hypothetical protein